MHKGGEYNHINNKKIIGTGVLLFIFSVWSVDHIPISTHETDQWNPAVYGNIVVWEDTRNGTSDIYGYNLAKSQEFRITYDTSRQGSPALYRDIIVWVDERNGNSDIYGYDLAASEEFTVTTDPHDQADPAVYGDITVWTDYRNGNADIYGLNLQNGEEFQITSDQRDQRNPAVYGDIVVWEDLRNGNTDIYGYSLSQSREFRITANPSYQGNPAVYGDIVVFEDYRNGNSDIYYYNLTSGQEFQITDDRNWQGNPALYENLIIWVDGSRNRTDIYGYDLSIESRFQAEGRFQVTRDSLFTFSIAEYDPEIFEKMVVWVDGRHNNADIYGCRVSKKKFFLYHPLADTFFFLAVAVIILLVLRKEIPFSYWIILGIVYGGVTLLLEEISADFGTILLLMGTPFFSVLCGLISQEKFAPVASTFSVFVSAFVLDTSQLHLGGGALLAAFFYAGLYSLIGVGVARILKKRVKKAKEPQRGLSCPNCGREIEKSWNVCPYCKASLDYTKLYDDDTRVY